VIKIYLSFRKKKGREGGGGIFFQKYIINGYQRDL
jgi:hypothetical protein